MTEMYQLPDYFYMKESLRKSKYRDFSAKYKSSLKDLVAFLYYIDELHHYSKRLLYLAHRDTSKLGSGCSKDRYINFYFDDLMKTINKIKRVFGY